MGLGLTPIEWTVYPFRVADHCNQRLAPASAVDLRGSTGLVQGPPDWARKLVDSTEESDMPRTNPIAVAPGAWPLVGHTAALLRRPLAFLTSLPAHGDLVTVRLGPLDVIVICDPALTRQMLLDDRVYDKGGPLFDRARELLGDGLSTCPHAGHRRQRRLTQPAFHTARFPAYTRSISAQVDAVTSGWQDGQVMDVQTEMMGLTSRATVELMFSTGLDPRDLEPALKDLSTILGGVYRRAMTPPVLNRLPTPSNRRYYRAQDRLRATIERVIATRRLDDEDTDHGDLLSVLLASRDHDAPNTQHGQEYLTDTEVYDQVVTFFAGGTETTATTLAWALHLLAQNPDIRSRLQEEVDTTLVGAPARYEDMARLPLTNRVITESLRLYPPVWMLTRTVTTDTVLGGHRLPAGTTVAYSPYIIHHRRDLYRAAERFDPDRWDRGPTRRHAPPPDNAFVPFAVGARKCIGDQLSMIEASLTLATITSRWQFEAIPGKKVRPAAALSLHPRHLHMRLVHRPTTPAP